MGNSIAHAEDYALNGEAMREWCSRFVIVFLIAGYGFVAICQYTGLGERVLQARESSVLVKIVLLFILSLFGGWGLMLYDWRKREFKTPSHRRRWLLVMTLGMMVGVLVYYVTVFEMGITVKQDENDTWRLEQV